MDLQLEGKGALVTGASKGIGRAVVDTLVAEGALVVAAARIIDPLQGLAGVTPVAANLVEPGATEDLVAGAIEQHGSVDVLVNNVGGAPLHVDGFLGVSDHDFEAAFALNFYVALRATRAVLKHMILAGLARS